jgi:hypothetical protein
MRKSKKILTETLTVTRVSLLNIYETMKNKWDIYNSEGK